MNTYDDHRGSLTSIKDIPFDVKEILLSKSGADVLRGLHMSPYPKRVLVVKGSIYDFYVKPETQEHVECVLNQGEYIDVPAGAAHGFYAYEPSELVYLLGGKFDARLDRTIFWNDPTLNLKREFPYDALIISKKDEEAPYYLKSDYFVLGARGFLGSACVRALRAQGLSVFESNANLGSPLLREQIVKSGAKFVICAAGISGKPTIDWCEQNEKETFQTNYVEVLNLMTLTASLRIHTTIFGSGFIFTGDKPVYDETDVGNLDTKVYSKWRIALEKSLSLYPHVLYLRILYPATLDGHPKCFLTKMIGRASSVHPLRVSMTIVPDLFPKISELCSVKATGIYNFVNDGTISLVRLLELYSEQKEKLDIQVATTGEPRGGYELSVSKLKSAVVVLKTEEAICKSFK